RPRGGLISPAGGGTPGYQAGLPRCGYAQASADHAGRAPGAPDAWHIPRPALAAVRAVSLVACLVARLGAEQPAGRAAARPGPVAWAARVAWPASGPPPSAAWARPRRRHRARRDRRPRAA